MIRILIADDEQIERMALEKKLKKLFGETCEVQAVENGREVLERYCSWKPQILILDVRMPGISGLEAAERIRETDRDCSIIFLTAFDEFSYAKKAISVRALDYILKPADDAELTAAVEEGIRAAQESGRRAPRENASTAEPKAAPEQEDRILSYVKAHFAEDLSVQDVAGHFGYADAYFCRIFKQHFGKSFVSYLTDYRIERAKEKLAGKETNIREVGRTVGYADPNYFAKVFRRVTGMSPTEYQQSMAG
ncbi:MAG: response regulator [Lachnospiraceae bacterium]|jgi:YesN/AraC family two-component response regulator|nr:response regulator [Lachnospiraceae bacterium]MCI1423533.1 response regulator [Lachnospiraceae bacterium]